MIILNKQIYPQELVQHENFQNLNPLKLYKLFQYQCASRKLNKMQT
ncbi:hypothetical protein pb186bvf_011983, partial [Paramecium bursaria]